MENVRIERVDTKADLRKFIRLPWKVTKDDPNWVPPLIMDLKKIR